MVTDQVQILDPKFLVLLDTLLKLVIWTQACQQITKGFELCKMI